MVSEAWTREVVMVVGGSLSTKLCEERLWEVVEELKGPNRKRRAILPSSFFVHEDITLL